MKAPQDILVDVACAVCGLMGADFLARLTKDVARSLSVRGALIAVRDPQAPDSLHTQTFILDGQARAKRSYLAAGTPSEPVLSGQDCVFDRELQRRFPADATLGELNLHAYAGVPLRDAQGDVQGLVAVFHDTALPVPEVTLPALRLFAMRVSAELDRDQREQAAASGLAQRQDQLRRDEQQVLRMIAGGQPLNDVLLRIVGAMEAYAPDSMATILLVDPDGQRLRMGVAPQLAPAFQAAMDGLEIREGAGSCGTAAFRREAVIVSDMATDPLWAAHQELVRTCDLRACWSTPVMDAQDTVCATFAVYHRQAGEPGADDLTITAHMAHLVSIAVTLDRQVRLISLNEERFRYVALATSDAIWDWNLPEDRFWWNDSVRTLFGHDPASLSTFDAVNDLTHPEDREKELPVLERALSGTGSLWEARYRVRRADGSYAHVFDRGYIIRDGQGRALRMVGGLTDISDRIALEEQLSQSQRMEAIGQLTGGVAHDFNNLLTVILGNAELLDERLPPPAAEHALTRMMITAAQRGAELTQHLLAFARRQTLESRPTSIKELLTNMSPLLQRALGESIEVRMHLADDLFPAMVDPARMETAVLNLCLNARDAMPEGGQLTVTATNVDHLPAGLGDAETVSPGPYVQLTVSDTGSGVPPELLPKVFEPFFTTKGAGKGTGLGLSMVYGFVTQSGGHITIRSKPGAGTTVSIHLPRSPQAPPPSQTTTEPGIAPHGQALILLVEDNPLIREYASDQLAGLGYTVLTAADGPTALVLLREHPDIDLLFTDIIMPGGLNGQELARQALVLRPGLRVLYTSGYTPDVLVHDSQIYPDLHFLAKPYRYAQLAAKVHEALSDSARGG